MPGVAESSSPVPNRKSKLARLRSFSVRSHYPSPFSQANASESSLDLSSSPRSFANPFTRRARSVSASSTTSSSAPPPIIPEYPVFSPPAVLEHQTSSSAPLPHQRIMSTSESLPAISSITDTPVGSPANAGAGSAGTGIASSGSATVPERAISPEANTAQDADHNQNTLSSTSGVNLSAEESSSSGPKNGQYCIRFSPFVDHSSLVPMLYFGPMIRKIKEGEVIKVGRFTEHKDDSHIDPNIAPMSFKSKVVSRSHATLKVKDGVWYITDVGSSSGTFLNHVRLSPANQNSAPSQLRDGDLLQLGMDFRGGSQEIYRCIKVRVELNKSWQKTANSFNVNTLSAIRNLTGEAGKDNTAVSECSICLLGVGPCQPLFIAPCSHTWHYRCIRPLVVKSYPQFSCPNCRAVCDLEEDLDCMDV